MSAEAGPIVWIGVALSAINIVLGVAALLAIAWRGGVLASRLETSENIAKKLSSLYPVAMTRLTALEIMVAERSKEPRARMRSRPDLEEEE